MAGRNGIHSSGAAAQVHRAALVLCNIILIVGTIVAAVTYSRVVTAQKNALRRDAFTATVESMKQVSENYFSTEKGYVDNWCKYIESQHMTEDEALEYLRASNAQSDRAAHIVDMETLWARSTTTVKGSEWVHCYEDFSRSDKNYDKAMLAKMKRMYEAVPGEVFVLGQYRVGETQQTVVSVGAKVTLQREDGRDQDYLLLRLIPVDYLQKSWVFPTEFPTAQISLITREGDYVIQSSAMRATNFLEFIRTYNYPDDYNGVQVVADALLANDNGLLTYKDSRSQDCYFYYSSFGDDSDVMVLGFIPVKDTEGEQVDWTIVVLICGILLLLTIIDGAHLLSVNRELHRTAELADSANRAKTQFLSSMSHDIRTPMNAVIGMTEIAKDHLDDPAYVKDCLDKVSMAGNHLLTLINDILDISKVESGRMTLNAEPFSLRGAVDEMTAIVQQNAEDKGLKFTLNFHDVPRDIVVADPLRLRQVLINLLTNAVKYTESGGHVRFDVSEKPLPNTPDRVRLQFMVADDGMGMSEEYQKTMYTSFTRGTDSRINKIQGSGLGLAIARQMTELMGGTIRCQSALGQGTTFVVDLELPTAESLPPEPKPLGAPKEGETASVAGMRVLAAEDNDLNWEIIHTMLEEYGIESDRAENGQICLDMLHSAGAGRYDLILMDVQMPVMNGREATRCLRADEDSALRELPVVAMTADAFAEDVAACRAAGMDGHISKPVDMKQVLRTLQQAKDGTLRPRKTNG